MRSTLVVEPLYNNQFPTREVQNYAARTFGMLTAHEHAEYLMYVKEATVHICILKLSQMLPNCTRDADIDTRPQGHKLLSMALKSSRLGL